MTVPDRFNPSEQSSRPGGNSRSRRARGKGRTPGPKRWYERTSVTLCVAAVLLAVTLGFVHVILGVTNSYGLPFDIVLRESFGYREMVIDPGRIQSLPYTAAQFKYPLSIAALQKRGYVSSGPGFEARMMANQRECVSQWQHQFEAALGRPRTCWQDQLQGDEDAGTDPEDAEACNQQGIAFARQGDYQAALAAFARAVRRNPTFADAFYNRAIVSIEIGNVGQAASDLGTVLEIRPGFVEGHVHRGRLLVTMNEHDEAIGEFAKAVEIDPRCAEALFQRGLLHYSRGDSAKALEDVHRIKNLGVPVPAGFLRALGGESESDRMEISTSPIDE